MIYIEPKGKITEVKNDDFKTLIVVNFDKMLSEPIAPAGLYDDPKSGIELIPLHKLMKKEGNTFTFETYGVKIEEQYVGDTFFYRGWWTKTAMEAAIDTDNSWELLSFPKNKDHVHCLFSWDLIDSHNENNRAYHSKYGWITIDSYTTYIKNDIYRIRS